MKLVIIAPRLFRPPVPPDGGDFRRRALDLWSGSPPDDQESRPRNLNCLFVETGSDASDRDRDWRQMTNKQTSIYGIERQQLQVNPCASLPATGRKTSPSWSIRTCNLIMPAETQDLMPRQRGPFFSQCSLFRFAKRVRARRSANGARSRQLLTRELAALAGVWSAGDERSKLRSGARIADGDACRPQSLDAVCSPGALRPYVVWLCGSRAHARACAVRLDHGLLDLFGRHAAGGEKKLARAAREGCAVLFYHDPDEPLCRLIADNGKFLTLTI